MISIFDLEKLRGLLKDFYAISHIRITVFDENLNELVSYPDKVAPYCAVIRGTSKGFDACMACDREACQRAAKKHSTHIYRCHAGLTEAATPLTVGDVLVDLSDHATEGPEDPNAKWYNKMFGKTSPIGVSIPFGMGVKFSLSRHMAGTVEWRMQKTFTDYLDDVATVYPEGEHAVYTFEDGSTYDLTDPTGNYKPGQQRGNSSFNDWFGMARMSLTWKFNLPDGRGCNLSKF